MSTANAKRCTKCGETKPLSDYYMRTDRARPRPVPHCKACSVLAVRDRRAANPAQYEHWKAERNRQRKDPKIAALGKPERCEICGHKFDGAGRWGPQYDHHHGTGAARGWLCNGCNRALGWLGDNPAILRAALAYLDRHGFDIKRPRIS